MEPIQYVETGGVHLAYRVVGDGDTDIVWVPGWVWDIEEAWNIPGVGAFLDELAGLGRLVMFDKRGTGQSDRVPDDQYPSLEERTADLLAVMDAAGSEQAALVGFSEGGAQALLAAAHHRDRVTSVVSIGGWARLVAPPGDTGIGIPREAMEAFIARALEHWVRAGASPSSPRVSPTTRCSENGGRRTSAVPRRPEHCAPTDTRLATSTCAASSTTSRSPSC